MKKKRLLVCLLILLVCFLLGTGVIERFAAEEPIVVEMNGNYDVAAVLVYDGVHYALNGSQLEDLEENGLESFISKNESWIAIGEK